MVSVVLYPDGEVLADALPAEPTDGGTFTYRATITRRADANGRVHFVLNWLDNEIASRRRLTDLLETSGNQSISMACAALDEAYIKARDAAKITPLVSWCSSCRAGTCEAHKADCPECVAWKGVGPSHVASTNCRSGRHPHCSCDTCY
jgi:hypothetical protein